MHQIDTELTGPCEHTLPVRQNIGRSGEVNVSTTKILKTLQSCSSYILRIKVLAPQEQIPPPPPCTISQHQMARRPRIHKREANPYVLNCALSYICDLWYNWQHSWPYPTKLNLCLFQQYTKTKKMYSTQGQPIYPYQMRICKESHTWHNLATHGDWLERLPWRFSRAWNLTLRYYFAASCNWLKSRIAMRAKRNFLCCYQLCGSPFQRWWQGIKRVPFKFSVEPWLRTWGEKCSTFLVSRQVWRSHKKSKQFFLKKIFFHPVLEPPSNISSCFTK